MTKGYRGEIVIDKETKYYSSKGRIPEKIRKKNILF
jgi:hypothetical protein